MFEQKSKILPSLLTITNIIIYNQCDIFTTEKFAWKDWFQGFSKIYKYLIDFFWLW